MGERIALAGGQITSVWREGTRVYRSVSGDRSFQHALLGHLETQGFSAAPRFHGIDAAGHEVLDFLPGETDLDASRLTDRQLSAGARLLRGFHDAAADFPEAAALGAETVCHNDWTPANTVFRDGVPVGMIDFDTARPGSRLWDVTYSAWTWTDLGDTSLSGAEQRRRLAVFIDGYGHPAVTLPLVALALPARMAGRADWARRNGRPEAVAWAEACLAFTLEHVTGALHPDGLP